ncbi:unnamed protein product [Auanema sp. JU1783]|nr:unnamed protein product [Auanema sp. JU1783]
MEEAGKIVRSQNTFKVLVIGDCGTGKTSIIRRYVHNMYNTNYKATIGVDFAVKILVVNTTEIVHLQMWDISGTLTITILLENLTNFF